MRVSNEVEWRASRRRCGTRDFEDVVAWLAQQMAKTPIAGLLRIAWDTVGRIVARVTADHLDERRLDGLVLIGVGRDRLPPRSPLPRERRRPRPRRDCVVPPGPQQRHASWVLAAHVDRDRADRVAAVAEFGEELAGSSKTTPRCHAGAAQRSRRCWQGIAVGSS
jgi:hypothetical protein